MSDADFQNDPEAAEEARQFELTLEQNGQLAHVGADENLSELKAKLPTKITHIRYPDGRIERIRFSNPYTG